MQTVRNQLSYTLAPGILLCARSPVARRQMTADFTSKTERQAGGSRNGSSSARKEQAQQHQQGQQQDSGGIPEMMPSKQQQQQHPPTQSLRKLYLALVTGSPTADSGSVDIPIGRTQHAGLCSGLYVADAVHGKPAKSVWHVVRRLPQQDASVLAVEIFSGVQH